MSSAEELVASVRTVLTGAGALREVRMFGGVGFMLNEHLIAGASGRGLLVRVGAGQQQQALARPGARPMVMRGRTMPGYVYVDPPALSPESVRGWLELAIPYVLALAPRRPRPKSRRPAKTARGAHAPAHPRKRTRSRGRRAR